MSDTASPPRRVRWYALVVPQVVSLAVTLAACIAFIAWETAHGDRKAPGGFVALLRTDFLANNLLLDFANLVLLGLSLWFLSRVTDPALPARLTPPTRRVLLIGLGAGIAAVIASLLFEYVCDLVLHTHVSSDTANLPVMPHRGSEFTLGAFTAVLLAPLAEEVYFRGLLMGWLQRHWGIRPAIIISSLLFGLLHLKFLQPGLDGLVITGELVLMGLLLGLVAARTGSLWASFAAHALNNLCALLAVFLTG